MFKVDLTGKLAVVTGGSRGIGRHIAEALGLVGAKVAITGRDRNSLNEAADEMGSHCRSYVCDQRNPKMVAAMAESVIRELGPPDILVNNAASIFGGGPVVDMPLDTWNEVIETSLTGVFTTTKAFLPSMIERDSGDIFIIGSMSGKKGDAGWAAYSAAKFGLRGFAQALLYEVRARNIRVMLLNPSSVSTSTDVGPTEGPGLYLHAADLAATIVHICGLPRRTLIRDMEIWGTNP